MKAVQKCLIILSENILFPQPSYKFKIIVSIIIIRLILNDELVLYICKLVCSLCQLKFLIDSTSII
jgi:hypothetical protein